ncbi:MAG: hypothetical protein E6K80_06495 [Candidatus Eisenbacteria bacterium]|uniref:DUF2231 domain-containing protein n=1 Tax=Eiseniibacteriota bacterium TaxID=2212470 RepID=A0A538U5Z7_UNCEI|nr:MAG: hypothetical protein E6K80_06495 [Candidatus Eisenbacteria bacterium]
MKTFALLVALMILGVSYIAAQPEDESKEGGATQTALHDSSRAGVRGPQAPYKMPPLGKALLDNLHNKLIHFPIVLTLVAAVMVIVARKKPQYEPVAYWLVWAAALSVIPAYFTGKAAEQHFEGKPKEWLAEFHEKQGIVIAITQALWVLSMLKAQTRRFAWIIGILLACMVLGQGFTGGLLAHGH